MISRFSIPSSNLSGMFFIIILVVLEWVMRKDERNPLHFKNKLKRYLLYLSIFIAICLKGNSNNIEFIYFQF